MRAYYPRCKAILTILLYGQDDLVVVEAVPRSADWTANTMREADTARIEFDYKDLPVDPRSIRSILVLLFCGDAQAPDVELNTGSREDAVFIGYADEPETALEESGERVTLTCRDYTGLFLDYKWGADAVNLAQPLEWIVEDFLNAVPGVQDLQVFFDGGSDTIRLDKLTGKTIYTPEDDDDAWTVLVSVCQLAGLIPTFRKDALWILSPGDVQTSNASFLYGSNLTRLTFKRKFNETRSGQVRLVCWDETAREHREATYPVKPVIVSKKVSTSGKVKETAAPITTYNVSGTFTVDDLKQRAERLYTEAAREEVEGELETHEMLDLTGQVSLTKLSNGDSIEVILGTSILADIAHLTEGQAIDLLVNGPARLSERAANALVSSWREAQNYAARFYVKTATHSWSRDEGYRLVISFINFITGGVG